MSNESTPASLIRASNECLKSYRQNFSPTCFFNRLKQAIQAGPYGYNDLYVQPEGYLERYTWQNATRTLAERVKVALHA